MALFRKKSTTNSAFTSSNDSSSLGELKQYTTLTTSKIYKTITGLNQDYTLGNFDTVRQDITPDTYIRYSEELLKMRQTAYPVYEDIRSQVSTTLQTLLQASNKYDELTAAQFQVADLQQQNTILNDMEKLLAHITQLKRSMTIFPDQSISVIPVQIKPEYLAYIQMFGLPQGNIWDPDRLALATTKVAVAAAAAAAAAANATNTL